MSFPINITKNTNSICNLNCSYTFKYPPTNLQIYNWGNIIIMKTDASSMPPVIYNSQNYDVTKVYLIHPSFHTYAGQKADAELIIEHSNTANNKTLLVCVPIMQSSSSTAESVTYFDLIVGEIQRTAPSAGKTTHYNNPTLSLAKFVPLKPYYSYSADAIRDVIAFGKEDAIAMSPSAFIALTVVTTNFDVSPQPNPTTGVFYNAKGPVQPNSGEIYIDCQPTGDDGEILVPVKPDSGGLMSNTTLKKMWNMKMMKIFVGALVMLVIWKISMKAINGIASHSAKVSSAILNKAGSGALTD